jgi:RNase P subunit RPR2
MKTKRNILSKISLSSELAVALVALGVWLPGPARAAEHEKRAHDMMQMQHISTQAQAEALKPGDSMSMTCSKCKDVMVQQVTADNAHVKMMTVGEKFICPVCGGTVEVVATGKGEGKDAEVKHVCSKCGDDAMFCSATKPGSGAMKDMDHEKK